MQYIPSNGLPLVEEEDAEPEVAAIYAALKREYQMPYVPNLPKALATSPAALAMHWEINRAFNQHTTLPQALSSMILYTIAEKNQCTYCHANHELNCRTLGVDEEILAQLVEDLGNVNPRRIRAIVEFALRVAEDPQGLVLEDYDNLREEGVGDDEILEIIVLAGIGMYLDIVADALKVEVDSVVAQALGR